LGEASAIAVLPFAPPLSISQGEQTFAESFPINFEIWERLAALQLCAGTAESGPKYQQRPGSVGTNAGTVGTAPGSVGTTPGRVGTAPESVGTSPGSVGTAPGRVGTASGAL